MDGCRNTNDEYDLMNAKLQFMRVMITGAVSILENCGPKLTEFFREHRRGDLDDAFGDVCCAIECMYTAMNYSAEQYFGDPPTL